MEDIVDMESELSKRLQEVGRRLEEAASEKLSNFCFYQVVQITNIHIILF